MLDCDVSKGFDNLRIGVLALVDENVWEAVRNEPSHQGALFGQRRTDPQDVIVSKYAVGVVAADTVSEVLDRLYGLKLLVIMEKVRLEPHLCRSLSSGLR